MRVVYLSKWPDWDKDEFIYYFAVKLRVTWLFLLIYLLECVSISLFN